MRKQRRRSASRIVQSLFFINPKFQASSHLLWLYRLVCVGPGQKPKRWFSHDAAHLVSVEYVYTVCARNAKKESFSVLTDQICIGFVPKGPNQEMQCNYYATQVYDALFLL